MLVAFSLRAHIATGVAGAAINAVIISRCGFGNASLATVVGAIVADDNVGAFVSSIGRGAGGIAGADVGVVILSGRSAGLEVVGVNIGAFDTVNVVG